MTTTSPLSRSGLGATYRELAHGELHNDPGQRPGTPCGAARDLQLAELTLHIPSLLSSNLNPCVFERRRVPTGFSYIRPSGCHSANRR